MQSRSELIHQLSYIGFAMDDIRLFLDTHPGDTRAIELFNDYAKTYAALKQEYTDNYQPFTSYCRNNDDNMWLWNDFPMPWEGDCK